MRTLFFCAALLVACGVPVAESSPDADAGADAGARSTACGPGTCAGCCLGATCVQPSMQDASACGQAGASCAGCGGEACFMGACLARRDAGSEPLCYLERPTTSCDDQGGPASGQSGDKGTCVSANGSLRCACTYQQNPVTGRCLGAPSGPWPTPDGGVCALEYQACSASDECCNRRHTCFPEGCHY